MSEQDWVTLEEFRDYINALFDNRVLRHTLVIDGDPQGREDSTSLLCGRKRWSSVGRLAVRAKVVPVLPHGTFDTVIRFRAVLDDGTTVIAGGDDRPMRDVIAALQAGETVETELEDWQVVRWESGQP